MKAQESAGALELGKYNHHTETYELGVNKWDYTQLRYTTDGYDRCREQKLPSMPSHERQLYHPYEFQQWPTQRYTSYECGTGWLLGCCMGSGVEKWRNWGPRLGSRAELSIEHSSLLFSSLVISILCYFFGSRPGINDFGTGFTTSGSQSMGGGVSPGAGYAARAPWAGLIGSWTFEFVRVRMRYDCAMLSFPFLL